MSEDPEAVPFDEAADAERCERLRAEGAALRLYDMTHARAFAAEMGDLTRERLVQALLEGGRPNRLVRRIAMARGNNAALLEALNG